MPTDRKEPCSMVLSTQKAQGLDNQGNDIWSDWITKAANQWKSKIEESLIQNKSQARQTRPHITSELQRANDVTQLKNTKFCIKISKQTIEHLIKSQDQNFYQCFTEPVFLKIFKRSSARAMSLI